MEPVEAAQPHEALFLILPYLPLSELLAVTGVCSALRDAVYGDILPWLDLVVQHPLSPRLSDDTLHKFASKAGGRLRTLSLSNCSRITYLGLLQVVQQNPLIEKLYLPGCTSLTPEGVINVVKMLKSISGRLRCLEINGIYGLNKDHLQTLGSYLEQNRLAPQEPQAPVYFHDHRDAPRLLTDGKIIRPIDVEICPKCDEVRMVFDCPKQTYCRGSCRGCIFCTPRCAECGVCVDSASEESEEAVCGDLLCSECWVRAEPKCSFCNRPYCRHHMKQETLHTSGADGFFCVVCDSEYVTDPL